MTVLRETFVFKSLHVKIQRANSLLAVLESEGAAFLAKNYKVKGDLDQRKRKYRFLAIGDTALPFDFSILIGEIVYHLRTVLDHLVFFLAGEDGNTTKLTFPICCKEREFKLALKKGALSGVSDGAVQVVERLQPYRTSANPSEAVLYQLHNLNIIDKHRLLLAPVACADMRSGGAFLVDSKEDSTLIIPPDGPPSNIRPSRGGEVIFQFEFAGQPHPDAIIKAVNVFEFKMKFDRMEAVMQNREVLPTLVIMRDTVTSVVRELCAISFQSSGGTTATV